MTDFWIYVEIGLKHVLSSNGYDHILFLMALVIPNTFKEWKKILLFVTVFTIGHTLALFLSVFNVVMIKASLVEFLIPITILITAVFNFFSVRKSIKNNKTTAIVFITLFFGVIHGLGFSNYFKTILPGNASDKLAPLLEFALGIEGAQMTLVIAILIVSYSLQSFLKISKRDFIIVSSALIVGVIVPMILQNDIWNR